MDDIQDFGSESEANIIVFKDLIKAENSSPKKMCQKQLKNLWIPYC